MPSVESHFGHEELTARGAASWQVTDDLAIGLGGSRRLIEFGDPIERIDGPSLDDAYDPATVPGYLDGVDAARGELSIGLDRRDPRHPWQSRAIPSTGWAAQAYAGVQQSLDDAPTSYGYGGLDVVKAIDLRGGDRVLSMRGTVDVVVGAHDEVPFVDLPTLGGTELLRGFPASRFRDHWAAAASAEYLYPVTEGFAGFVFVDVGRVAADAEEMIEAAPHLSGGIGVQVHGKTSMQARAWVAATDEGGVGFNIRLEPLFRGRGREGVR